jgi:hypothetical protein
MFGRVLAPYAVLTLMEVALEAPNHTTLSRRSQSLNVDLHRVAGDKPVQMERCSTAAAAPESPPTPLRPPGDS